MRTAYVIKHPTGGYIGVDHNSGGYPWLPNNPFYGAKFWNTKDEAEKYMNMFCNAGPGTYQRASEWKLVKVQLMEIVE